MPSCIITGATGYIGSHVAKHLLSHGWEVSIIAQSKFGYANIEDVKDRLTIFEYDGDISSLISFFKGKKPEVVMHLAAAVITNYSPEQIPALIRSNVEFGTEILEAMRHSETKLFIGTGSYWQNYKSERYSPVDLYAATKEAFEKILQFYVDAYSIRAITLRLYDVYGEDDRRPKLWNLLRNTAGTPDSIDLSPGEQLLDLVHVSDVARAYESAYHLLVDTTTLKNEVYGVYTGRLLSLREAVKILQEALGKTINCNWGKRAYKQREVMVPSQIHATLPNWSALVVLEDGFEKFKSK